MASKSNIIKKKPPSYINGLKAITNWFFSNRRKKEELENIIDTYKIDNNIIKRFMLYTYNTPHMTWYINKYLNSLYEFNRFDTVNLLYSLVYLLDVNRITRKSIPEKLMYLKNTELSDRNKQKIKELLYEFFDKIFDKNYNDSEMNYFYDLVNLNVITFKNIEDIDKHINSGKSTLKLEEVTATTSPTSPKVNAGVLDIYKELPSGIKTFCNEAKEFILAREECKGCELFGKPTVIMDTNVTDSEEVDIAFIGLNPGTDEVEIGKPFVGKAGKILRERMSLLPNNVKWAIYNVILCHTKNENEIKNPDDVKARCKPLVEIIMQTFPSKIYVPLGAKAFDWFGLKGSVASLAGKVFTNNNMTIVPVMHPSAANYNPENLAKFKSNFQSVLNLFNQEPVKAPEVAMPQPPVKKSSKNYTTKEDLTVPMDNDKFINKVTPDLTFFDVREINNKILKIYIDKNGQKKYLITDYELNFFLKNANWKQCDQITDGIDAVVTFPGRDKYSVIKKIRDRLNNLKGV